MSASLGQARCFTHASREAAAKCPQCGKFYCRECVTEHEGRVVCRACLDTLLQAETRPGRSWISALFTWLLAGVGAWLAAYGFYLLGRMLLRVPSEFHSGIFFE